MRSRTRSRVVLALVLVAGCGAEDTGGVPTDAPVAALPMAGAPSGGVAGSAGVPGMPTSAGSAGSAPVGQAGAGGAPTTPEPAPVEPPTEPAPTEPVPTEPAPTEPAEPEPATPPASAVPCGAGWGSDPIPGSVDLGLASNPETTGVPGGLPDEVAIFEQINAEREAVGLEPLTFSEQVANVARSHAADINQLDYFDHGSSTRVYRDDAGTVIRDNWLPLPRLEFVYPGQFRSAGENIARYPRPVERVVPAWMDSPGHKAAILDEYGWTATHGGVGVDGNTVVFSPARCR